MKNITYILQRRQRLTELNELTLSGRNSRMIGRPIIDIPPPQHQEHRHYCAHHIKRPLPAALCNQRSGNRPRGDRTHIAAHHGNAEFTDFRWWRPFRDQPKNIGKRSALRDANDQAHAEQPPNRTRRGGQRTEQNGQRREDECDKNKGSSDSEAIKHESARNTGHSICIVEGAEQQALIVGAPIVSGTVLWTRCANIIVSCPL